MPRRSDYGNARVSAVEAGSAAHRAGLQAGDGIVTVDGSPMRDAIDFYLLLSPDGRHELLVERVGRRISLSMESGRAEPGIEFEEPVFGSVLTCNNRCAFCFVDNLPPGLRPGLYLKDDDYRLSFLQGNFVTLTNLSKVDVRRIVEERLSPLYVSLHSTEPEVRRWLFGTGSARHAPELMRTLAAEGIEFHVQLVLMRGVNDGAHLEATMEDVARMKGILSVGVVPVGLAGRRAVGLERYGFDATSADDVLKGLDAWRGAMGERGPYAADEWFFMTGQNPPESEYYGDYPQIENGIGMTRRLLETAGGTDPQRDAIPAGMSVVTTPAGAWALGPLDLTGLGVDTIVVDNTLFGPRVNVCGLMTGADVIRALEGRPGLETILVPDIALAEVCAKGSDPFAHQFIDGVSIEEVSRRSRVRVRAVPLDARVLLGILTGEEAV